MELKENLMEIKNKWPPTLKNKYWVYNKMQSIISKQFVNINLTLMIIKIILK